jgi:uncharacterized protein YfbU (UPF0304 family)
MELSKQERLILSNQYRILERLYPKNKKDFARCRTVVERGYALDYDEISEDICDEMSIEESQRVLDILSMYSALDSSAKKLDYEPKEKIVFRGFDGNNEPNEMNYTSFYVDDLEKFPEIEKITQSPDYNSHIPTLTLYEMMLDEWNKCKNKNDLTEEEIERILNVRIK